MLSWLALLNFAVQRVENEQSVQSCCWVEFINDKDVLKDNLFMLL